MKNHLFVFIILLCLPQMNFAQTGNWVYVNDGTSCSAFGAVGSCSDGRHEASYVEVGDKFVLLGGRENNGRVNIYDPVTDIWTLGATPPISLHHFQAVEYHGMVLVVGSMTGNCCNEPSTEIIYLYDLDTDTWHDGPDIPDNRERGGAGCVIHNGDIYLLSGTTTGHSASGWVTWFDKYDPETDTWTELPDAPRARDHFHAAVVNNKLYSVAGRRSGADGIFNATVSEVDVYDFDTGTWQTLPNDLPTQRAGNTVAVLGDELIVIGGERESGNAKSEVEALDVNTSTWRNLADLNRGRHGSQAIVNNENIWVASGSPNRGGGRVQSQERFYFTSLNPPILTPINKSTLSGPTSETVNSTKVITFTNTSGNQSILIENIGINGADFGYNIPTNLPFILKPGDTYEVEVTYSGSSLQSGDLSLTHTGANIINNVALTGGQCSVGLPCDDNDSCTTGDVYDANCDCLGIPQPDSDNDGICNINDVCPGFDDNLIGTSCDDGDICTINDTYESDCQCRGIFQDEDNDNICDANDACVNIFNTFEEEFNNTLGTFTLTSGAFSAPNPTYESFSQQSDNIVLQVGGVNNDDITNLSLGITTTFEVTNTDDYFIELSYILEMGIEYEANEIAQALLSINGQLFSYNGNDYLSELAGDSPTSTGVQDLTLTLSGLSVGTHSLTFGIFNNQKTHNDESSSLTINYVNIGQACPACDANQIGMPCDDTNECTINDIYDANCFCAGTLIDDNNNNICDIDECIDIELYAHLEGAFDVTTGEMTTMLNTQRGMLPGQTPVSALATPTVSGQPYGVAPWNYLGYPCKLLRG